MSISFIFLKKRRGGGAFDAPSPPPAVQGRPKKPSLKRVKVTVHVGAVQTFEIEIFAENKNTLNELLVNKNIFQYV